MENKNELDNGEKLEIKQDVKTALNNAGNIEKLKNLEPKDILNQAEIDKMMNEKKHQNNKWPVILTIVLLIIIALVGLFIYFSNNPKTIFIKTVNSIFTDTKERLIENDDLVAESATITDKNSGQSNTINYERDSQKDIMRINVGDLKIYSESNKTYLYSKSLQTYIEVGDVNLALTNKEIKTLLNAINVAVIKSIENEKFNGSKMQIEIDDNFVKTYRSSLQISENNSAEIDEKITNSLQNNKKFINVIKTNTNLTESEIKTKIANIIDNLQKQINDNITVNIYTKGAASEFVKLEINQTVNDEEKTMALIRNSDSKYTLIINNEEFKIFVKDDKITVKGTDVNNEITYNTMNIAEVSKENITSNKKLIELTDAEKIGLVVEITSMFLNN